MLHRHKITILLILLSFSSFAYAGVLGYIDTGRVNSQVIMAGVTPSIIDAEDTEFDILALVRPGLFPLQNVTIGQGKGAFNSFLTHINTLANGDQIWKKTLGFERSAFGKADLIIKWGSGDGQYFIRAIDTNQQSFDANTFPLIKIANAPYQIVNVDTSKDSNLIYNSKKRNLPQIIMAGVSPAIVDIVDTSFDILTIIRPGVLPIKSVILKQGGNNLFSYSMDKRTDLSNGDQLWGTNFAFPQGSFGIQAIPIVWGNSLNEFTIEVIDSAQQKAPGYPLLRSGNYPLVTSAITCKLLQLRDSATNTCYTPNVTCTAPQVRNAQTNTCYTPDITCTAPQLRNAQTNTCYTPDITCTAPQVRDASTNTCAAPPVTYGIYKIGDKGPAGGIVFYVYNAGKNGLEAQAADYVYVTPLTATNFTATKVTKFNWQDAVTAGSSYGSGWHLPTKDELNQLYSQKNVVGGFAINSYWSSTESSSTFSTGDSSTFAWLQIFLDGLQLNYARRTTVLVRAVRAF